MSGKQMRVGKIFKEDGRTLVVAMDHGQFNGPMKGIINMKKAIQKVVAGDPDAIILNPGVLAKHADLVAGKASVILRITGASTNYSTVYDYHHLTTSVKFSSALGADAVIVMGFIGGDGENKSLEIIGHVSEACEEYGMPLIAEMLPQNEENFMDVKYIATGARAAYELGADILKVYYTGEDSFSKIVDSVPIPVVIAGGPENEDAFSMAKKALELGTKGVAYGRNVFQAEDPTSYVKRLRGIIHEHLENVS